VKARRLIDDAASIYSPATAAAVRRAFDEAWASISLADSAAPRLIDDARQRLAAAILTATHDGDTDVERIKRQALKTMASDAGHPSDR
jgi:hypothetical protein